MSDKPYCCYLAPESVALLAAHPEEPRGTPAVEAIIAKYGCALDADWDIFYGPRPDDNTQSCQGHLGVLVPDDGAEVHLYRLKAA